jgi:hypothetical protein
MKKQSKRLFSWQRKQETLLDSTEILKENSVLSQQPIHPAIPSSTLLHRSCRTLSLASFVEAHCNNNLKALIISGTPEENELLDAWTQIVFEYSSLIKSVESDEMFELAKEIGLLQWKVTYVDNAVFLLRHRYDVDVVHELINMGYDGVYDPADDRGYQQQLDRVISLTKTDVFDLEQLIAQYERLKNTSTGKKQTEFEFLKTIQYVSQYQGYPIDRNKTTVEDFAVMFNNYIEHLNFRKKEANHG